MDWGELEARGLYDPLADNADERRELLVWLDSLGCTVDEMVIAERDGRLFALAGDRQIRPGRNQHTLSEVAARIGVPLDVVQRVWRAGGLPDAGADRPIASDADVEALVYAVAFGMRFGEEAMLSLVRVTGASVARIAEAVSSLVRSNVAGLQLEDSGSELVTAQAFAEVAEAVPRLAHLIDVLHRHHLETTRRQVELSDSRDLIGQGSLRLAVGFADLSGFTAASQAVPLAELSQLVSRFEERASDLVFAAGGRVVKFIGDAVMFVAPRPDLGGRIALGLVDELAGAGGLPVRVGVTYGEVLSLDGDYFGPPVNLASRLVGLAEPGTVLLSTDLADRLGDTGWELTTLPPQPVRGYTEPVTAVALRHGGVAHSGVAG